MTGDVAQVFLTDEEWLGTLRAVRDVLVPGGHLVFETRIPERRAWEEWAGWGTSVYHVEGVGEVRDVFELSPTSPSTPAPPSTLARLAASRHRP